MSKTDGGPGLIGMRVKHWVDGEYGRFLATGTITKYEKVKDKGGGANVITGGRYLIKYVNGKSYWRKRKDFEIENIDQ